MQHFQSRWVWPMIVGLPIISGEWSLFLILVGFGVCSQSLHESIHHPSYLLARPEFRFLGVIVALVGTYLLGR